MSHICGMQKNPKSSVNSLLSGQISRPFSRPIVPPFTARVAGVIVTCRVPGGASWNF
jgi:hypothetical protein